MSALDVLLAGALFALPLWRVATAPDRRLFALAVLAVATLAIVQLATEGLFWQLTPGYLLLAVLAALAIIRSDKPVGRTIRLATDLSLAALALIAAAPWMLVPPVPRLTEPEGPYAVGTEVFRWIDDRRPENATEATDDRRNVIVQAWYPADTGSGGDPLPYIDGLGRLPPRISLIPAFVMEHYGRIDTHARANATVSTERQVWPVVLLGPGYGAPRAIYTGLATGLASRGYVVLALDHPYESAVTELADGTIATTIERRLDNDPGMQRFMRGRLDLRVADMRFVMDQLDRADAMGPRLAGRLDLSRIVATGHSLGGAAAALAMDVDNRIIAAANIDGTFYGDIPGEPVRRPFLLLDSDHSETGHSAENIANNRKLLDHFGPGSYRYEIARANHFGFTDAPLFLAPPARLAASILLGGGRGPVETQHATVDMLDAFLSTLLKGEPTSIAATATNYGGIAGGPVN